MSKYLDQNGLSYFWGKLKAYFQSKLVSGTNIKTVNGNSLLGSGDLTISGTKKIWTAGDGTVNGNTYSLTTDTGDFSLEDGNILIWNPISHTVGSVSAKTFVIDGQSAGAPFIWNTDSSATIATPITLIYVDNWAYTGLVEEYNTMLDYMPLTKQVSITVANWNATTTCTKSVTGVTASNSIIVSPAQSSISDYVSAGVYCSAQASGTLTFMASSTPTADLVVNVMIVG